MAKRKNSAPASNLLQSATVQSRITKRWKSIVMWSEKWDFWQFMLPLSAIPAQSTSLWYFFKYSNDNGDISIYRQSGFWQTGDSYARVSHCLLTGYLSGLKAVYKCRNRTTSGPILPCFPTSDINFIRSAWVWFSPKSIVTGIRARGARFDLWQGQFCLSTTTCSPAVEPPRLLPNV